MSRAPPCCDFSPSGVVPVGELPGASSAEPPARMAARWVAAEAMRSTSRSCSSSSSASSSRHSSTASSTASSSLRRSNNPYARTAEEAHVYYSDEGRSSLRQVRSPLGSAHSSSSSSSSTPTRAVAGRSHGRLAVAGSNPLAADGDDADSLISSAVEDQIEQTQIIEFRTPPEENLQPVPALLKFYSVSKDDDLPAGGAATGAWAGEGEGQRSSASLWASSTALPPAAAQPSLTNLPNPKGAVASSTAIPVTAAELEQLLAGTAASDTIRCPAGWSFSVYDADMLQHYAIGSQDVFLTHGAVKYVDFFQKYGLQTRFRFQLCKRFLTGGCASGTSCQYIHSHVLSNSTQVHINENSATNAATGLLTPQMIAGGNNHLRYPTLQPGVVFSVYPPNAASQTPQTIPSERILVTVGAQNVYNVLNNLRAGDHQNNAANLKPRHCAHFQFKRMCNLGSECNFVHSLTPYIQGLNATMPPALRNQPVPPVQMSAHQGHGQQRQRTSVAVLTQDGHVVHVPSLAAASQRHVSPAGFTNHHQLVYQTGQPHHQQFSMQAQGHSPHSLGHVAMQLPMSTAATQYLTHSGVDAHRQGQGFQGVVLAGPPLGRGGVPPLMYFHPNQTQQLLVQVLPEAPRAVPFTQPRDGSPSFLV